MEFDVFAPGKAILFGEHAVVYGKDALATSLGLETKASFTFHTPCPPDWATDPSSKLKNAETSLDPEAYVEVIMRDVETTLKISLAHLSSLDSDLDGLDNILQRCLMPSPHVHATNAAKTFLKLISLAWGATFCKKVLGTLRVVVTSQIPVGAGLGSSASFAVCMAAGIVYIRDQYESGEKATPSSSSFGDVQLERINSLALAAEQIIHGDPSGIDNAVCTYGGALHQSHSKEITRVKNFPPLTFLLVNTLVPKCTRHQVEKVRRNVDEFPFIFNPMLESIGHLTLYSLNLFAKHHSGTYSWHELVTTLKKFIHVNHNILSALGVSHHSLERVRDIASAHGLASKLTGAGGGGCALVLVPPDCDEGALKNCTAQLESSGFQCYQTSLGGPGVRVNPEMPSSTQVDTHSNYNK